MSEAHGRELVLVVGVGRSGTSLVAGLLGQLGLYIPQPEVEADQTNPRGFGEPRWVVDFHTDLLEQRYVSVNDARPHALELTGRAAPAAEQRLRGWLGEQFGVADAVVVKDPRTIWFLPLWLRAAEQLGVLTSFVTMLRHPAEIVASARKHYGARLSAAARASAWINLILHTEHATRGSSRCFVRYEDVLDDWETELRRVGAQLGSPWLAAVDRQQHPEVERFIDPALHRNRVRWEALDVPPRVRAMADDVWREIRRLAEPGEAPDLLPGLDARRAAYIEMYAEAEAIAQSSVHAARRPAAATSSLRVQLRRALGAVRARGA